MILQACEVTLTLTFLWVFSPLVILHMLKQRTELLFMVYIQALLAKKSPATLMSALDKLCIDHLWLIPCVVCEGRHCWAPRWPKGSAGASSSCSVIFPIARSVSFSPSLSLGCTWEAMGSSCRGLLSPF